MYPIANRRNRFFNDRSKLSNKAFFYHEPKEPLLVLRMLKVIVKGRVVLAFDHCTIKYNRCSSVKQLEGFKSPIMQSKNIPPCDINFKHCFHFSINPYNSFAHIESDK